MPAAAIPIEVLTATTCSCLWQYEYEAESVNGKNNWIIFELEVVCGSTFLNLINLLPVGYINLIKPLDTS